jgi:hypothetical protein
MTPHTITDLRVASYKLAKKRRAAAKETAAVIGQKQRQSATSRALTFPGKPTITVGAPSFSGTVPIEVAPGVWWSVPPGSRTIQPVTGRTQGVYVVNGVTGNLHLLRVNEHGAVEEVDLPESAEAEARERFGIK